MTVLVVGESLVDIVTGADGTVQERPGGSPLNVAVGLGRLGLQVQLATAFGLDEHGRRIQAHLAASDVEVSRSPLPNTSVAHVRLDADGHPTYEFDFEWRLAELPLDASRTWLHVGSLAVTQEPGAGAVAALVDSHLGRAAISYDPNCRPLLMGAPEQARSRIEEQVTRSNVVKLSEEDADWLYPGEPLASIAQRWLELGPALVVATCGADGAQAWTATRHTRVPASAGGPVVDTVGAGDAFMAGLVWTLMDTDLRAPTDDDVLAALVQASQLARRTCERAGADPPWRAELTDVPSPPSSLPRTTP